MDKKEHKTFLDRPDIVNFIKELTVQYGIPGDKLEAALTLVAQFAYNDGYLDGMRFIMRETLKGRD